jgi:hypothetical protein
MKKYLITLLTALCALPLMSQVPGYMGKKLSAGLNVSSFFHFTDYEDGIADMLTSPSFSYKTELALTYTVARRVSVGGSFYYGSQKYLTPGGGGLLIDHYGGGFTTEDDYIRCRLMMYEFNIKIFRKNFLAPIGPYHQLGIAVVKYKAVSPGDTLELFLADSHSTRPYEVVDTDDKYTGAKLSYHIGYAAPVFKNCFFNFAFGFNYFLGGDTAKVKSNPEPRNFVLGTLNRDLRRYNNFEFKLGLSYLL